jgi:hypothetical protein
MPQGNEDLRSDAQALERLATTTYRIIVITGTADGAGTDANVYITLYGDNGSSGERQLDTERDNFERGQTDVFSPDMPDLGNLQRVRIRHDNSGSRPGWFLDRIIILNETTQQEWTFPCNRWLAVDEDDGQIDRILQAAQ